jgi:hypothetical protein
MEVPVYSASPLPSFVNNKLSYLKTKWSFLQADRMYYVPQFVPQPLARAENGDKQFWK